MSGPAPRDGPQDGRQLQVAVRRRVLVAKVGLRRKSAAVEDLRVSRAAPIGGSGGALSAGTTSDAAAPS
jgi:hypothetical protein